MMNTIKYQLSHLTSFNGRDARQTFWYYILMLFVVQMIVSIIAALPMYFSMFGAIIEVGSQGGAAMDEQQIQALMFASMAGQMKTQAWISFFVGVAMCLLMVAAFVRRLHDAGYSGWIAAIPVATYLFSLGYTALFVDDFIKAMGEMMTSSDPSQIMAMQGAMGWQSLISWIGIIIVIVFGVMKSTPGPNPYGDEPVRF
ncbi:MAG: DUF805 domain-containing protein [Sphingomonadaceae bacterium]